MAAEEFFKTYVSKRQPVVINGLPEDDSFKARAWVSACFNSDTYN
jgi:hypothetical protein